MWNIHNCIKKSPSFLVTREHVNRFGECCQRTVTVLLKKLFSSDLFGIVAGKENLI